MTTTLLHRLFEDPVPNMSTAMVRAKRGAEFLDAVYGDQWHQRIDANVLNIGSFRRCMLSQLLQRGCFRVAFLSVGECVHLGFSCGLWDLVLFFQPPWISRSYHRLTEAWKLILQSRAERDQLPLPKRRSTAKVKENNRHDPDQNQFTCAS